MNNFIYTDNSIVNLSKLLAVVIHNNPETIGHSDTAAQVWFTDGTIIPVTRQIARELIATCRAGWDLSEAIRAEQELTRLNDVSFSS